MATARGCFLECRQMIHIRVDDEIENSKRRFECGIGPELPPGDKYVFPSELAHMVDCPGCLHGQPQHQLGTPLSEVSGRPGTKGFGEFVRIAESWGYP
jgi:hypothetical protein